MLKNLLIATALFGATMPAIATTAEAKPEGPRWHFEFANYGYGHWGIPPKMIRQTLRWRGFHKIRFLDRQLPEYVVKACRNGNKVRLGLNRWGKIRWRERVGRCGYGPGHYGNVGLPPHAIRKTLKRRGFYNIAFKDRQLPLYVVRACKHGRKFNIGLNRHGNVMWRKPRGHCGPVYR